MPFAKIDELKDFFRHHENRKQSGIFTTTKYKDTILNNWFTYSIWYSDDNLLSINISRYLQIGLLIISSWLS